MLRVLFGVAAASFLLPAAAMAQGSSPFTIAETGKGFARLQEAVSAVGDAQATIRIAPGAYRDCAVQQAGRISFVAAKAGMVVFDGGICEDKAVLVLRGRGAVIDGIIFRNLHVPDGNGAGIRLERGPLEVRNAMFRDSEEGLLTADDPNSTITIDRSTFSGLGRCDRGLSCAHGIYVGHYGGLTVTRSRFERGRGGHYVKSRAARISVTDSSFDDSQGKATNYMIDLPAGATGMIARNIFVQGKDKENHGAMIAIAAEGRENSSLGLAIADNIASLAPGVPWPTLFVADWSREPLRIGANQLGKGITRYDTR